MNPEYVRQVLDGKAVQITCRKCRTRGNSGKFISLGGYSRFKRFPFLGLVSKIFFAKEGAPDFALNYSGMSGPWKKLVRIFFASSISAHSVGSSQPHAKKEATE